jgi:D-threo-aldose 1-dehydrogenase
LTTSALGLGTAGIFHEPSKAARLRLLETAIGAGIIHFDLSPIYGLGLAHGELRETLRGRRENFVIATKVGIEMTSHAKLIGKVQGPARTLLKRWPRMQDRAQGSAVSPSSGRLGGVLYRTTFETKAAQRSLDQSLRELGTHIDLLLLHDPEPSQIDASAIYEFLETAKMTGRIRCWGIAGETETVTSVAKALCVQTPVAQVRDDILRRQIELRYPRSDYLITFGLLGSALPAILRHVNTSADRSRKWSNAVGEDITKPEVVASLLLQDSLQVNATGTVLYSTTRPERLREAAAIASRDSTKPDPSLVAFRQLVHSQLPTSRPTSNENT